MFININTSVLLMHQSIHSLLVKHLLLFAEPSQTPSASELNGCPFSDFFSDSHTGINRNCKVHVRFQADHTNSILSWPWCWDGHDEYYPSYCYSQLLLTYQSLIRYCSLSLIWKIILKHQSIFRGKWISKWMIYPYG